MKRREIQAKLPEIAEFSGVEKFLDTPVKRYSSGMHVRLAFSVAAHFEPEIMLVDEVLSVGDAEFQARCLGRMEDINTTGRTVVFVSHQVQAVAQLCDRVLLIDEGRIVRDGPSAEVVAHYLQSATGTSSTPDMVGRGGARGRSRPPALGARRPPGWRDGGLRGRARARGRRDDLQRAATRAAVVAKIKVVAGGQIAFNAMDVGPRSREPAQPGDYVTTAWIPGNFLNEGLVTVDAAVCSIDSPKLHHHVSIHEAVSFHVQDPLEGDSSRGTFTGQWRGVVRPLLDWTTEEI